MKKVNFFKISIFAFLLVLVSCENELDLPNEGSIEDVTPPSAEFSFVGGEDFDNFTEFLFGNLSVGATTYLWDFGDGTTSDEFEPAHTFPGEGTFMVSLQSSDALGVIANFSQEIQVIMPEPPAALIPDIIEGNFDSGDAGDIPVDIDTRDSWRNSSLGGVIQLTTSGGFFVGNFGAKLPPSGDRIGYQVIGEVTPNTDYVLSYFYTFRDQVPDQSGNFTVGVTTPFDNPNDYQSSLLSANTHTEDVSGTGNLLIGTIIFNSGNNSEVAIYFFNDTDEAYVDEFEIDLL